MLSVIIILLILLGLAIHRYLTPFWEQRQLPSPGGFAFFANLFALIYLVSFVWMFGFVVGIVVSILCYFQIVYSTLLWIFLLPWLVSMQKQINRLEMPSVNILVYGGFSFIIVILGILTIVNFFVSDYQAVWKILGGNLWVFIISSLVAIVVGNVLRMIVLSRLGKD